MIYKAMHREYKKKEDETRGKIIYHTILLERIIDAIISRHFINDTNDQRFHEIKKYLIADRMEFSKKVEVLKELLTIECNMKNVSFTKQYPRFGDDFKDIGQTRNDFAHNLSLMPPDSEINKYDIILYKYRKNEADYYTPDIIKERLDMIFKYIDLFSAGYEKEYLIT